MPCIHGSPVGSFSKDNVRLFDGEKNNCFSLESGNKPKKKSINYNSINRHILY